MSYILSVWHVRLDACRFKFERRKKEITFFLLSITVCQKWQEIWKADLFVPLAPHTSMWCERAFIGYLVLDHTCAPPFVRLYYSRFKIDVFFHSDCYLKWKKIYSPKIVFTMYLALADRCRPLVATALLEHWFWWVLFNTKNTQEVMTSLSNEAEYK